MYKIFLLFILISSPCFGISIHGTNNDDILTGTDNPDYIAGYGGNDKIYCLNNIGADDNCRGGDGNDWIEGGDGKDYLKGENGSDHIIGGNGDDNIIGGSGDDILIGGNGIDYFVFYQGDGIDYIDDFENGIDKIVIYGFSGNFNDLIFSSLEDYNPFFGTIHITIIKADTIQIWFFNKIKNNFSTNDFIFR